MLGFGFSFLTASCAISCLPYGVVEQIPPPPSGVSAEKATRCLRCSVPGALPRSGTDGSSFAWDAWEAEQLCSGSGHWSSGQFSDRRVSSAVCSPAQGSLQDFPLPSGAAAVTCLLSWRVSRMDITVVIFLSVFCSPLVLLVGLHRRIVILCCLEFCKTYVFS